MEKKVRYFPKNFGPISQEKVQGDDIIEDKEEDEWAHADPSSSKPQ